MKRPFRERWLLVGAHWAEYRRNYGRALARLKDLESRRPLETPERAFRAYLLLRDMKPDDAHDLFIQVREAVKGRPDPDSAYLKHYAQFWLAMIKSDPFNIREQGRAARKVECDPLLKRWLWVGDVDAPDPLDVEFDAWMKANAPDDDDLRKRPVAGKKEIGED